MSIKRYCFLLAMALYTGVPLLLNAQLIHQQRKDNPAISEERLRRIDSLIDSYINKDWLRGVVTLIIKDNEIIQYKGYGYIDWASKRPMPKDAIFRIMSQTKALTSTAIMILYEQGKLRLDEPIADFIPEFRHMTVLEKFSANDTSFTAVPAKRELTFRDLLTHTSGIDYADIGTQAGTALYAKAGIPSGLGEFHSSLLDKMRILAKQPLIFQPGERWMYGLNTDLLGCLVEVISGVPLEDFLRIHIFEPLGMKDTYFNVPSSKANRLAEVYTEDSLHQVIKWSHTFRHLDPDYPLMHKTYFSGGAGLSSTAFDYAVFMQMLLNGGIYNGHRILSPRTVEMMTSNQLDFPYNGVDLFGLGFGITSAKSAAKNPRREGSFGWGGYYGTTYWADPKSHLVCLIMTQQTPNSHWDFEPRFEALVYSSLMK